MAIFQLIQTLDLSITDIQVVDTPMVKGKIMVQWYEHDMMRAAHFDYVGSFQQRTAILDAMGFLHQQKSMILA